jgi:tetratricopeptide (TPR) repeat protein
MLNQGELETAEVFIRALKALHPRNFMVFALEGLYLDRLDEVALSQEAYRFALDMFSEVEAAGTIEDAFLQDLLGRPTVGPGGMMVQVLEYLLKLHLDEISAFALRRALQMGPATKWLNLQAAQLYRIQRDHIQVIQTVKTLLEQNNEEGKTEGEVIRAFEVLGHTEWEQGRVPEAVAAFETYLEWEPTQPDALLLARIGSYYQQQEQWEDAEQAFLKLAQVSSMASAWLGVGIALMKQKQYSQALSALRQANRLDNTNTRVWGMLTSVHLEIGDLARAATAFDKAFNLGLDDTDLLSDIGRQYLNKGYLEFARKAFERSLEMQEGQRGDKVVMAHLDLGDVYGAQNRVDQLVFYYKRAFELAENEELKRRVVMAIALAMQSLGRESETERYLQFIKETAAAEAGAVAPV